MWNQRNTQVKFNYTIIFNSKVGCGSVASKCSFYRESAADRSESLRSRIGHQDLQGALGDLLSGELGPDNLRQCGGVGPHKVLSCCMCGQGSWALII